MSSKNPLFVPPNPPFQGLPFGTDKLDRKPLAAVLTDYIQRLRFGAVIAIEAEWGEGKTWFAKNWQETLAEHEQTAIYIDAFEADYIDDPFSMIAGEIQAVIKSNSDRKNFVKKAAGVALAIAPTVLKAAVRGGGKVLLGQSDITETLKESAESILESGEESLGKILEDKIKNYSKDKQTITSFRESLSNFAISLDKPLVIIIDELDRCKPEFAVKLLERIKHFFEVNNVVFVLFINKRQLHNAIKGFYGDSTDAHLYLDKFLNFTFLLESPEPKHIRPFLEEELNKYSIKIDPQVDEYLAAIALLSRVFKMTTRQLERAIGLLALAHPFPTAGVLLAEMAVLKICKPTFLEGLVGNDGATIHELIKILEQYVGEQVTPQEERVKYFFLAAHRAQSELGDGQYTQALHQEYNLRKDAIKRDYRKYSRLLNMVSRN